LRALTAICQKIMQNQSIRILTIAWEFALRGLLGDDDGRPRQITG
jgi:hypothetical protein